MNSGYLYYESATSPFRAIEINTNKCLMEVSKTYIFHNSFESIRALYFVHLNRFAKSIALKKIPEFAVFLILARYSFEKIWNKAIKVPENIYLQVSDSFQLLWIFPFFISICECLPSKYILFMFHAYIFSQNLLFS